MSNLLAVRETTRGKRSVYNICDGDLMMSFLNIESTMWVLVWLCL